MNEKQRFIYEMMDTPTLAQHTQKCVLRMHDAKNAIRQAQLTGDKALEIAMKSAMNNDKNLHRQLTRMIQSRQLNFLDHV